MPSAHATKGKWLLVPAQLDMVARLRARLQELTSCGDTVGRYLEDAAKEPAGAFATDQCAVGQRGSSLQPAAVSRPQG
jgi:hypothetical protein